MSNKTSRTLLIVEAIIIALPVSLLATLVTGFYVNQARRLIGFDYVDAQAIFSLLSLAAICSGWRLFGAYFRGGADNLRRQHTAWWAVTGLGVLILLAAWISRVIPPTPAYSFWSSFQLSFEGFVYASPILIPLVHLAFERFVTRTAPKGSAAIDA